MAGETSLTSNLSLSRTATQWYRDNRKDFEVSTDGFLLRVGQSNIDLRSPFYSS